MNDLRLLRRGLKLEIEEQEIPAQWSGNVPVIVEDDGSYVGYTSQLYVRYTLNGEDYEIPCEVKGGGFLLPFNAFEEYGTIFLAIHLLRNDEVQVTNKVKYKIVDAPGGNDVIDKHPSWRAVIEDYLNNVLPPKLNTQVPPLVDKRVDATLGGKVDESLDVKLPPLVDARVNVVAKPIIAELTPPIVEKEVAKQVPPLLDEELATKLPPLVDKRVDNTLSAKVDASLDTKLSPLLNVQVPPIVDKAVKPIVDELVPPLVQKQVPVEVKKELDRLDVAVKSDLDKVKNLIVTTTANPLSPQDFICDHSSSEIRNALIEGRTVVMYFEDTIEKSGNQVYPFLRMDENGAHFRRLQIRNGVPRQIDIKVDYAKNVTFEDNDANIPFVVAQTNNLEYPYEKILKFSQAGVSQAWNNSEFPVGKLSVGTAILIPLIVKEDKRRVTILGEVTKVTKTSCEVMSNILLEDSRYSSHLAPQNLLINGDFQCNQRGQTTYTNNSYGLDMWTAFKIKVEVLSDGWIRLTNLDTAGRHDFKQKLGRNLYAPVKYTASLNVRNFTGTNTDIVIGGKYVIENITNGLNTITFDGATGNSVAITIGAGESLEVQYFDLFEGDIAYPHIKEDYALALTRCQRYINRVIQTTPIVYRISDTEIISILTCDNPMVSKFTLKEFVAGFYDANGTYRSTNNKEVYSSDVSTITLKITTPKKISTNAKGVFVNTLLTCEPL